MFTSKNVVFQWKILNQKKEESDKDKVEEIVNIILKNRGLKTKKEIKNFLNPLHPSEYKLNELGIDKKEVTKAIKRIIRAIEKKESIVVYADYDADGVCAGTIVWEVLHQLGANVMPYIPHRKEEGYGLSKLGIDKVKKEFNPKLIITVDHGISASDKIKYAQKLGMDIIVIDHHVKSRKPPALAIIHSTQLCASGVSWVFIRELAQQVNLNKQKIDLYLDLVALATIADLVPLLGPNRSIVKYGLEKLNKTNRVGLLALINSAALEKGKIGVVEVGHMIAPRINAMGRLMHALDAMRLLCTPDVDRAYNLANTLNLTNRKRQLLTADTILHAKNLYREFKKDSKLIFIAHESYNQGIIGLVAGKLVEEYFRPAIVVSKGEIFSKASARSVVGFNIIETIRKADELLVDSGGHPMAAGFTVKTEYIEKLRQKLEKIVDGELKDKSLIRALNIDCQMDLTDINWNLYQKLKTLEPFGVGNPEPLFVARSVVIEGLKLVGRDSKHIKMNLSNGNGYNISAIAFGLGSLYRDLFDRKPIDIAFTMDEDRWNGESKLQLKIKDVKISQKN